MTYLEDRGMGPGIMDHFPEKRRKEQLGRSYSERVHSTLKELKAARWDLNSESQDVEK